MAYEHKEGGGTLFKNKAKQPDSKQPDYRGEFMLNGKLYEIAGWMKNGAKGPFMSLSVQEPRQQNRQEPRSRQQAPDENDPW